ncbi:RNA polymerase factor sigma-54 [Ectobacillus sp. JY-23]|uniref:RNA polymerase factor sigma-54 n=1 Tax=Ectobacillus sp. JY-23 TaxID=2933872 RepID=UPI001FF6E8DC|nr:RNA polymerase factor sigma-54 [Ectobacillus sp. JY-23]UOY91057.1 RNA polymerase factor sigma-54 [Ectobacillus sp. JY-23]
MKASLVQEQSLRLAMTQELRQAIAMLQYNAQELTEFLYEQSLENPLIELKIREGGRKTENQMEIYGSHSETLQQHLLEQLRIHKAANMRALRFIVDNIDENGYLRESDEELAALLNIPIDEVRACVHVLQDLEPAGVGARTLQECLLLQLKRLQKRCGLAEQMIAYHFNAFAKKDWKQLTQALKCHGEELQQAMRVIVSLQPKPGLAFSSEKPLYVVPDLAVHRKNGELIITVEQTHLPKIEIHPTYSAMLTTEAERDVASYLAQKQQHVQWLLKSLEQRKITLLRVMEVIVARQSAFFMRGPLFVQPLALKEVATELGLHESTVSRATRNKFVQTPYGLFEMKYFFSNAVSEEDVSALRVKELLKSMIEKEDKRKPLSDQKIVQWLEKEHGIAVSRRTVAKYREQLKIPASSLRKTM